MEGWLLLPLYPLSDLRQRLFFHRKNSHDFQTDYEMDEFEVDNDENQVCRPRPMAQWVTKKLNQLTEFPYIILCICSVGINLSASDSDILCISVVFNLQNSPTLFIKIHVCFICGWIFYLCTEAFIRYFLISGIVDDFWNITLCLS